MIRRCAICAVIGLVVLSALPVACEEKMLQIRGSDTIVNLVQRMAEVYQEKYPERNVTVTGGGSGTGIAGLRNRTVDIANSSRTIRQREVVDMNAKGVNPIGIVIGIDCITIIVNKENTVDKLTMPQLGAIFRGEVSNWREVGGADMPITLYGRQSNSGTYELFKETVVESEYSDHMRRMNGNSQIVECIIKDASGIGFVGRGYAENEPRVGVVKIAASEGGEYVDPRNANDVETGKYALTRPLYQYTNGIPSGAIRDFIKFELGPEGKKIIEEMGFIPITKKYEEENSKLADL